MIYAIEAVGTEFIKFGRAKSVGQRLKELEVGCPFDLHIVAVANWPDGAETAIHRLLSKSHERGEWFRDGETAQTIIKQMLDAENGLQQFREAHAALFGSDWKLLPKRLCSDYLERHQAREELAKWRAERVEKATRKQRRLPSRATPAQIQRRAEREAWWRLHGGRVIDASPQARILYTDQGQVSADSCVIPKL